MTSAAPDRRVDRLIERVRALAGSPATPAPRPGTREQWWDVPGRPPVASSDPPPTQGPPPTPDPPSVRWRATARALHHPNVTRTPSVNAVEELIDAFAADLSRDRRWLLWAVRHPWEWMDRLRSPSDGSPAPSLHEWWSMCGWAAEALHRAVGDPGGCLLPADRPVAEPLAARLRFLVLTEPLRHRGPIGGPQAWIPRDDDTGRPDPSPFDGAFGENSWDLFVARAREARWAWLAHLDEFASCPLLAEATTSRLEGEVRLLVFREASGRRRWRGLTVQPDRLHLPARLGADDRAVRTEVVERHLLPRFQLAAVLALAHRPGQAGATSTAPVGRLGRLARQARAAAAWSLQLLFTTAVVLLVLATLWSVTRGQLTQAGWTAAGTYLALGLGVVLNGPLYASAWLLRWPAAAALGLLALVGLHPHWWKDSPVPAIRVGPIDVPAVTALLAMAAFGYLVVEARNHRVSGAASLVRAFAVLVVGTVHALFLALLGLLVLLPEFSEDGTALRACLTGPDRAAALRLLADTAAWCLSAGVFSQILWDDHSITAPLAHTRWQSGRPR